LAIVKGIAVKGDECKTDRRDDEVDRHCSEQDGGGAENLRVSLERTLVG